MTVCAYTVLIDTADTRDDEDRVQVEIARHMAVIFGSMFRGVEPAQERISNARTAS